MNRFELLWDANREHLVVLESGCRLTHSLALGPRMNRTYILQRAPQRPPPAESILTVLGSLRRRPPLPPPPAAAARTSAARSHDSSREERESTLQQHRRHGNTKFFFFFFSCTLLFNLGHVPGALYVKTQLVFCHLVTHSKYSEQEGLREESRTGNNELF